MLTYFTVLNIQCSVIINSTTIKFSFCKKLYKVFIQRTKEKMSHFLIKRCIQTFLQVIYVLLKAIHMGISENILHFKRKILLSNN